VRTPSARAGVVVLAGGIDVRSFASLQSTLVVVVASAILGSLFAPAGPANAAVVYQSGQTPAGFIGVSGDGRSDAGDNVILGGTDRHVVRVDVGARMLGGTSAPDYTGDFTLTLYRNDGPVVTSIQMPGTVIASSTISASFTSGQSQTLAFPFAAVEVPQNVHFQVSEGNPNALFQLQVGGAGTVGSSSPGFLIVRPSGGAFQPLNFGSGNNVVSTFNAVPEPAGMGLVALGAVSMLARRRR
jgi:hypothetical protein